MDTSKILRPEQLPFPVPPELEYAVPVPAERGFSTFSMGGESPSPTRSLLEMLKIPFFLRGRSIDGLGFSTLSMGGETLGASRSLSEGLETRPACDFISSTRKKGTLPDAMSFS